jgi:hypothetical protein
MKQLFGGAVAEGIIALTLKEDTDTIILMSNGGDTGSWIQDDLKLM